MREVPGPGVLQGLDGGAAGVKSPIRLSRAGENSRGSQIPEKNIIGKKASAPTALPALADGTTAASSRPTDSSAAAASRKASRNPSG